MGAATWIGRICCFLVLAAAAVWAVVVGLVMMLSIMWGPPCTSDGFACGSGFWPGIGIALGGCAVVGLVLVIALPLGWRHPVVLWSCAVASAIIGLGTAVSGFVLASG